MLTGPRHLDRRPAGSRERWLVSYADVLTILLMLFVAIAAKGIQHPPPLRPPPPRETTPPSTLSKVKETLEASGLKPRLEARGLVISLPQAVLFGSGDDRINPAATPTIQAIAAVLARIPNRIALAGYSDAVPIHTPRFRNNWELSAARGLSLLAILSGQYGIDESRLSVASYGSWVPAGSNETEEGRAANRRVEIVIQDNLNECNRRSNTSATPP